MYFGPKLKLGKMGRSYGPDFWTKTLEKFQNLRIDYKIRSLWANRKSEFKLLLFFQVSSFTEFKQDVRRPESSIELWSRKCNGGNNLLEISKWNVTEEAMREIDLQNSVKTFSGIYWPSIYVHQPLTAWVTHCVEAGRFGQWIPSLRNLWWASLSKLLVLYMFYCPYACWTSSDVSLSNGFEIKTLTNFRY